MNDKTRQEIQSALAYLSSQGEDKDGARRGLEDWFYESMVEEGLMKGMMSDKHEAHLMAIKQSFSIMVDKRYRSGNKEHGGFILDKVGLIDEAIEEAIDLYVYLVSLKEQLEK